MRPLHQPCSSSSSSFSKTSPESANQRGISNVIIWKASAFDDSLCLANPSRATHLVWMWAHHSQRPRNRRALWPARPAHRCPPARCRPHPTPPPPRTDLNLLCRCHCCIMRMYVYKLKSISSMKMSAFSATCLPGEQSSVILNNTNCFNLRYARIAIRSHRHRRCCCRRRSCCCYRRRFGFGCGAWRLGGRYFALHASSAAGTAHGAGVLLQAVGWGVFLL